MDATEKIETKTAKIWIDEEGIMRFRIKEGAAIDLQEVAEHFTIYRKLVPQKSKVLHLFESGKFFRFDTDAMQYVAKHAKDFFIASAVVHDSLAIRILYNFVNNFIPQPVPFKMFSTKGAALEWLRSFKPKHPKE
jgi:hypothetical protein